VQPPFGGETERVISRLPGVAAHAAAIKTEDDMGIIIWLIVGLLAGLIARALLPGDDSMGFLGTLLLGLGGSLVGGFLGNLLFDASFDIDAAGIIGSVIGAVIVLLIVRVARARTT
jgi:uncharacterized membrane protein YeaQ/YmgE (transglycosylase-associated protein family)